MRGKLDTLEEHYGTHASLHLPMHGNMRMQLCMTICIHDHMRICMCMRMCTYIHFSLILQAKIMRLG